MELQVFYRDSEADEVWYSHPTYGLVVFHMESSTAVIDDKWDEVDHSRLIDDFEPQVHTEDVIEAVAKLPFVEEVQT